MLDEIYDAKLKMLSLDTSIIANNLVNDLCIDSVVDNKDNSFVITTNCNIDNGSLFSNYDTLSNNFKNVINSTVNPIYLFNILKLSNNKFIVKI